MFLLFCMYQYIIYHVCEYVMTWEVEIWELSLDLWVVTESVKWKTENCAIWIGTGENEGVLQTLVKILGRTMCFVVTGCGPAWHGGRGRAQRAAQPGEMAHGPCLGSEARHEARRGTARSARWPGEARWRAVPARPVDHLYRWAGCGKSLAQLGLFSVRLHIVSVNHALPPPLFFFNLRFFFHWPPTTSTLVSNLKFVFINISLSPRTPRWF